MRTVTLLASDNKTTFTAQVPDDFAGPVVNDHAAEPDPQDEDDSGGGASAGGSSLESETTRDGPAVKQQDAASDADPDPSSWMTSDEHVVASWVPPPPVADNNAIVVGSFNGPDPVALGGYVEGDAPGEMVLFDDVSDSQPMDFWSSADAGQASGGDYWSFWNTWSLFEYDSNLRSKPADWDFVA